MKNATMLDLGEDSREIEYSGTTRSGNLMIELMDDRLLSKVAADFEGRKKLVRTDTSAPGVATTYEGYTELIDIRRNQTDGSVRLTLRKP